MMAEKAELFGDEESVQAIMAATAPKTMKPLGRKVRDIDPGVWEATDTTHTKKVGVRRNKLASFARWEIRPPLQLLPTPTTRPRTISRS
jgi:predicted NAD-dependent protein-ADP-ribosyltransferase YbiA (DUF1768 family)